jgi:SAM-dependent methyltransferase
MLFIRKILLCLGLLFMFNSAVLESAVEGVKGIISHRSSENLAFIEAARERIEAYPGDEISKSDMHLMLDQLILHPIGRSIFFGKGLDGNTTHFVIKGLNTETNAIIRWLLNEAPAVLATRERFSIFQKQIQKRLCSSMHLASVPCGLMDDLLGLDFSKVDDVKLTGIDLDQRSLDLARQNAEGANMVCDFYKQNAWDLSEFEGKFDLITSNGLNIYEADDAKVTALYKEFFKVLKPGGTLITSFLTLPPALGGTTWKNFDHANAIKQRIVFGIIIGAGWQHFRSEETTAKQLKAAGFVDIEVIYDSQGMFPTVVANKPK